MSATNRGSKRVESDFYSTPKSCIQNFLNHYGNIHGTVLEPSAGNGNIVDIIKKNGNSHVTSLELRKEELNLLITWITFYVLLNLFDWQHLKVI